VVRGPGARLCGHRHRAMAKRAEGLTGSA
jgi:hypothetical protein